MMKLFSTLSDRVAAFEAADLYPVVSSEFCLNRPVTEVIRAIAEGGAKLVQLREKNCGLGELYALAEQVREITASYGMLLVIDDHVDVALAVGADAVHLGLEDLPVQAARRIAPELLIGASTHNLLEAEAAYEAGAGYINVGPVYPTQTKSVPTGVVGLSMVQTVTAKVKMPFSVMGGIKERHLDELLAAGCRHIAMVTEITQADDITKKVKALRRHWGRN